jgi:hypothetical protein
VLSILDSLDGDVNRQLLNILVTANNGDMLITDNTMSSLKDLFKNEGITDEALSRFKQRSKTIHASCQTDVVEEYPPLAQIIRNHSLSSSNLADIASTSNITEGVLPLVIRNFSQMQETMRGPIVGIRGVPWRIMVMPRQHVVQKKGTQKCLGFFLQCCPTAYSDQWSCQASAELRLISQKTDVPNFTRKTSHSYTAKENDWGYSCFMTWADILDETQGYIKDNTVKVEVVVKADSPKNILDHTQFQKKIREYIRLADVQASRGYIDKAIEVNNSASKFCKDKDPECKNELETQLKRLIELKLKESIERIEKGNSTKNGEEDNLANINALRQAMGGGSAARSQKAQKVVKKDGDTAANKDAAARKQTAVRSNKFSPRSVEEMRRDIEKQVQKTAASQKKGTALPAPNRPVSGISSAKTKLKTNGTTTTKSVSAPGRSPDSSSKAAYRKIYNDEMRLSDNDEASNTSTENAKNPLGFSTESLNLQGLQGLQGNDADVYVGENQISLKLSSTTDEPDFNLHIAKVMETLKDISPDFHEAMRKTFRVCLFFYSALKLYTLFQILESFSNGIQ